LLCGNYRDRLGSLSISSSRLFVTAFTLAFATIVVGSVAIAEAYVRRNVTPNDVFDVQRTQFHDGGHAVAAFGDSRINSGITRSRDIANFAVPGDAPLTVLGKFATYTRDNPQARIILQAAPQQFSTQRMNSDQSNLLAEFLDPHPQPLHILRPHLRRFFMQFVRTAANNPSALFETIEPIAAAPSVKPPTFADLPHNIRRIEARQRIQHHTPVSSFASSETAQIWQRTLRDAVARGVDVCLVTMPVSAAYRKTASTNPTFAATRNFYHELAADIGVPYVDMWAAWPDNILVNSDHIHESAASDVTRSVISQCFGQTFAVDPS
jgi:hypothetical protein